MAKTSKTFEELVTGLGMDPLVAQRMAAQLQLGKDQEAVWRAWCAPLIEQARRIEHIVNNCPELNTKEKPHSLNRPGLHITLPDYGTSPHVYVRLPNGDGLSLKCDPRDGVYLYNHFVRRNEQGAMSGSSEVYAYLERSWYEQSPLLKDNWDTVFGNAPAILNAAENSLKNGTPLGSTQSWTTVLIHCLENQSENEISPKDWRSWVQHWGEPQMIAALGVIDSLFDSGNKLLWREQLVQSWKGLATAPTLENLDPVVFSNHQ